MKLLSCLKYGLLAVHVAASGAICMMADTALRSMFVLSGIRSSQVRSLQFVLLALLTVGVLVGTALADRRFSRAKTQRRCWRALVVLSPFMERCSGCWR